MNGKFRTVPFLFWRQSGDCCKFFELLDVIKDDGEVAELKVTWCKKLHRGWKKMETENIRIGLRDYNSWVSYTPTGELFYED